MSGLRSRSDQTTGPPTPANGYLLPSIFREFSLVTFNSTALVKSLKTGVDWHSNLRLWGTGTISGISCETLAGLVSIERVMQCAVLFG